jgi:hypothetical protein
MADNLKTSLQTIIENNVATAKQQFFYEEIDSVTK